MSHGKKYGRDVPGRFDTIFRPEVAPTYVAFIAGDCYLDAGEDLPALIQDVKDSGCDVAIWAGADGNWSRLAAFVFADGRAVNLEDARDQARAD